MEHLGWVANRLLSRIQLLDATLQVINIDTVDLS